MSVQILTYAVTRIFKETDSSGETRLQLTENSNLQKCIISIQPSVYSEMIRLFPMKVPVKKFSGL